MPFLAGFPLTEKDEQERVSERDKGRRKKERNKYFFLFHAHARTHTQGRVLHKICFIGNSVQAETLSTATHVVLRRN